MNLTNKFDFKSIKFKLWIYFISFAALLIILIWGLQILFLNNFYEKMKISETTKIANKLVDEYTSNYNLDELSQSIISYTQSNDLYIKVETEDGDIVISPDNGGKNHRYFYSFEIQNVRETLRNSSLNTVSSITPGRDKSRTLSFGCYLYKQGDDEAADLNNNNDNLILYICSPLYPVDSTISILRSQLLYITIISALLSLALALYLANKISKPIKNITASAAKMGQGNYSVQFKGGHYSEITELADTLTNASNELEKTDMYQKDLIANVSHDLRTPLTMIKSYAEMIRDLSGDNPTKREAHLHVIIEEADRLNVLVSDMLNMSRMQSKKIILEKTNFDIVNSAKGLLSSYDILSEKEGYIFKFNCANSLLINGDETKIKQVMSNLINNAVKYCGNDKTIIINLKRIGKKMRCEVIDHGAGISPDEINHVWERYYKSSTHHVRPTEGSGLGLSIVREILNLHKAEYGVESEVGKGSTFWFELPIIKK